MKPCIVPAGEARSEVVVLDSRFVASVARACTLEEARDFVVRIRREAPGATHHVPAYVIGHGAAQGAHCQDDGEPSGTAGRPVLAAILGSGLGDVVLVVTRYFGGTRLGTGRLARAYGAAARSVLDSVPRAEKLQNQVVRFGVPYAIFERCRLAVASSGGLLVKAEFGVDVTITASLPVDACPAFTSRIEDLSAGIAHPEIIETVTAFLPLQAPALHP